MALEEAEEQAALIIKKKATMNDTGQLVSTPSIKVYQSENCTIRAGKFYRKQNNDVYIGVKAEIGNEGSPTILHTVDRSRIPSGFTFTYVEKEEGDSDVQDS